MRHHGNPRAGDSIDRILSGALGVGLLLHDAAGVPLRCNDAGATLLGISTAEPPATALERLWRHAIREDGSPFPADAFPPVIVARTRAAVTDVVMGVERSGGVLGWIRVHSSPVSLSRADDVAVVTTLQDVTERGHLEELVALQAAVATLPVGVVVGENPPGRGPRILAYNEHYRRMVGSPAPEGGTLGASGYRVFQPDRRTELAPQEWPGPRAARLGQPIDPAELHVLRPDGTWLVVLASAAPVRAAADGRTTGAVVVTVDVTVRPPAP